MNGKKKMKFKWSVKSHIYSSSVEAPFPGYNGMYEMAEDFKKVVHYHELKYEDYKRRYIEKWGQERWDSMVEHEAKYET
jgi:hypothetical protein